MEIWSPDSKILHPSLPHCSAPRECSRAYLVQLPKPSNGSSFSRDWHWTTYWEFCPQGLWRRQNRGWCPSIPTTCTLGDLGPANFSSLHSLPWSLPGPSASLLLLRLSKLISRQFLPGTGPLLAVASTRDTSPDLHEEAQHSVFNSHVGSSEMPSLTPLPHATMFLRYEMILLTCFLAF